MDNLRLLLACYVEGRQSSTAELDGMISPWLVSRADFVTNQIQEILNLAVDNNPNLASARISNLGRPNDAEATLVINYKMIPSLPWYTRWVPFTRTPALRTQQNQLGSTLRDLVSDILSELESDNW